MSFHGAGIFISKINVRLNTRNGIDFEISLCSCSLSILVTDSVCEFTAFEMEQSLHVMFRVQGDAVSAEVSLHASRTTACKKLC